MDIHRRLLHFSSVIMRTSQLRWSCSQSLDPKSKSSSWIGAHQGSSQAPKQLKFWSNFWLSLQLLTRYGIWVKTNSQQNKQRGGKKTLCTECIKESTLCVDTLGQADNQCFGLHFTLRRKRQYFGVQHYLKGLAESCMILFPVLYLPSDLIGHVSACFSYLPQASPQVLCTLSFLPLSK